MVEVNILTHNWDINIIISFKSINFALKRFKLSKLSSLYALCMSIGTLYNFESFYFAHIFQSLTSLQMSGCHRSFVCGGGPGWYCWWGEEGGRDGWQVASWGRRNMTKPASACIFPPSSLQPSDSPPVRAEAGGHFQQEISTWSTLTDHNRNHGGKTVYCPYIGPR